MTLEGLAQAARLNKSYISRVERGLKTPSIATLIRIAAALNIQMSQLFGESTAADAIAVIKRDGRIGLPAREDNEASVEIILPANGMRRLSAFLLMPGKETSPETAHHPGDELIFVLDGALEVVFADRVVSLEAGDCVHFDGHLRHKIKGAEGRQSRALLIVANDLATS